MGEDSLDHQRHDGCGREGDDTEGKCEAQTASLRTQERTKEPGEFEESGALAVESSEQVSINRSRLVDDRGPVVLPIHQVDSMVSDAAPETASAGASSFVAARGPRRLVTTRATTMTRKSCPSNASSTARV